MKTPTVTATFTERQLRFLVDSLNAHLNLLNDRIKHAEEFRHAGVRRIAIEARYAEFNAAHDLYDSLVKQLNS